MNHYRMHPDVLMVERPDGSSCLLHMSGNTCRMDAHSTRLLKSILEAGPERSVLDLAQRFGIGEDEAREDVSAFISDLGKQRIIRSGKQQSSTFESVRTAAARLMVLAALSFVDRRTRRIGPRAWGLLLVARWSVALFGWARTIKVWEQRYPQPDDAGPADAALIDEIDRAVRRTAARSFLNHQCKERALACVGLSRARGVAADLIIGLVYMPVMAHVWVECGDRLISDNPANCMPYEPVARYGKKGSPQSL